MIKTPNGDKSVPITWAYNHHYEAYLVGRYAEIKQVHKKMSNVHLKGANNHRAPSFWFPFLKEGTQDPRPNSEIPISQYFSEGNGGESRYVIFHHF